MADLLDLDTAIISEGNRVPIKWSIVLLQCMNPIMAYGVSAGPVGPDDDPRQLARLMVRRRARLDAESRAKSGNNSDRRSFARTTTAPAQSTAWT